jgi:hypothetical protein
VRMLKQAGPTLRHLVRMLKLSELELQSCGSLNLRQSWLS